MPHSRRLDSWNYAEALVRLEEACERIAKLDASAPKPAETAPREAAWKASYLALQSEATKLLVRAA